jgi:hypothetical protein
MFLGSSLSARLLKSEISRLQIRFVVGGSRLRRGLQLLVGTIGGGLGLDSSGLIAQKRNRMIW